MKEIIKLQSRNGNTTVSASELHEFLGIKRHLTQWLEPYIKLDNDYGFVENVDFSRINAEVNPTNGIPVIDYELTMEMAKELSMLSKSEKGKEARKYFINCEKQLKNNNQLQNADITKQIAQIVQAQLKEQFNNQAEMVDNKYSQYIRPTALTKRSISDYIKKRLGVSIANNEYELVKKRILISLGARQWQDVPVEVLKDSIKLIDECIDIIKKDRPYYQISFI